jgi:hypothetical protein
MAGVKRQTAAAELGPAVTDTDPVYVAARRVLLDALDALSAHRDAVVLIGAHAVYLRTGAGDIAVAPFTTDADLAIDPSLLAREPELEGLMGAAGFSLSTNPGSWVTTTEVGGREFVIPVDLMVPDAAAPQGSGRRSVNLDGHSRTATRRAMGLEPSLIDNDAMEVAALEAGDPRVFPIRVAGAPALMIAKLHKIGERVDEGQSRRIKPKDAGDVYRLMVATPATIFVATSLELQHDERTRPSVERGLVYLDRLFGARARPGVALAVQALEGSVPAARVEAVCSAFARETREVLAKDGS